MSKIDQFDIYLKDDGPVAIVIREHLISVEGADGVIFPATYAAGKEGFPGGYNIDGDPDGENVALIDSVGAQANRIEPIFADAPYASLIPQIVITAGSKSINLLHAGHRAGDAIVRSTPLHDFVQKAFRSVLAGDVEPLTKIAPTSLVFGAWDSRDTQAKVPRLISSTIRAFNVRRLTRSAQFNPAVEYVKEGLLDEPADKETKDMYAEKGYIHIPAPSSHGGIISKGGIRRDATLSLSALRLLKGANADRTLIIQRYVLGLALVAFTHPPAGYLRQGTNLCLDPENPSRVDAVYPNGRRDPFSVSHDDARAYAELTAAAFVVTQPEGPFVFEKERALKDVTPDEKKTGKSKVGKKTKDTTAVPGDA